MLQGRCKVAIVLSVHPGGFAKGIDRLVPVTVFGRLRALPGGIGCRIIALGAQNWRSRQGENDGERE